jgi:uncharacterized repeat protein (TIGR01451 family)
MKTVRILLITLTLLAIIPLSSAKVTIDVQHTPSTILPGDVVEYTLTLKNEGTQDVRVSSLNLVSDGVKVNPKSISNIGTIAKQSSVDIPFTVEAIKKGTFSIDVHIYTENESLKRLILVNVEDKLPDLILTSSLNLNEVNELGFYLTNPLGSMSSVSVEALFDAEPRLVYLGDLTSSGSGKFKYIPEKEEAVSFKISFYNGINYHEFVKTITPEYRQSKGLVINASVPYTTVPVFDVIPLDVTVSNLRNDTIYSIQISASMESSEEIKIKEIAYLNRLETSKVSFQFSPAKTGKNTINVDIAYEDDLNNKYSGRKKVDIFVLDEKAISVTNIDTERSFEGITISGDISNSGRSTVYNVLLAMQLGDKIKTFYLGSIDSSDFDSFEFEFSNVNESKAALIVSWNNELGEKVEFTKEVEISEELTTKPPETGNLVLIGAVIAVAIVVLVAFIWMKSGK